MQILTNGELLHALIQPLSDRLSHYRDIISIISAPFTITDSEGFNKVRDLVQNLSDKGQSVITLTDPDTSKLYTFKFEAIDDIISFSQCVANQAAAQYAPIVSEKIGTIQKQIDGSIDVSDDWVLKSADGLKEIAFDHMAELAVDMNSVYSMMNLTIHDIITKGEARIESITSCIRTKLSGVRGVAKTFMDDLIDAGQGNNISSIINVIKAYLNNNFISASADGSWSFTESKTTKEWNAGFIVSAIGNIVTTIGSVVTALAGSIGLLITGIGALTTGITNLLSSKYNDTVYAVVEKTEGREVAVPILQQVITGGTVAFNTIGEMINGKGPCHFEFLGIDGYIWSSMPDRPDVLVTPYPPIDVEFFPSSKAYVPNEDLIAFINTHITKSFHWDQTGGIQNQFTYGNASVKSAYSTRELATWYIDHAIEVKWDDLSDIDRDHAAKYCWFTSLVMLALLLGADKTIGSEIGDWSTQSGTTGLNGIGGLIYRTFISKGYAGVDSDDLPLERTLVSDYIIDESGTWVNIEDYSSQITLFFNPTTLASNILKISQLWYNFKDDPAVANDMFMAPFTTPVVVRYPFHVLPAAYDRDSLLTGIILTTALVVITTTVLAITAVKAVQWRQKQQALTQAKTESAWQNAVTNPTAENIAAYRKACLKQNTVGKIFGCSSVSNRNYWGGSDTDISSDDGTQTILRLLK